MASQYSLSTAQESIAVARTSALGDSDGVLPSSRKPISSLPRRSERSLSPKTSMNSSIPRKPIYPSLSTKGQSTTSEDFRRTRKSSATPGVAVSQSSRPSTGSDQSRNDSSHLYFGQTSSRSVVAPVSGSLISAPGLAKKNVLRRRPSVIGSYVAQRRQKETTVSSEDSTAQQQTGEQVYGLGLSSLTQSQSGIDRSPQDSSPSVAAPQPVLPVAAPHDLRPFQTPTPLSTLSVTPSLIFTDSPSGFSYRTTPNSYASSSPHLNDSPQLGTGDWSNSTNTRNINTTVNPSKDDPSAVYASRRSTVVPPSKPAGPRVLRKLPPKQQEEQVLSGQPQARTPPPELAHLMVDATSSRAPRVDETKNAEPKDHRLAAQNSLPRLDTFIGHNANTHRKSAIPVAGEKTSKSKIHRKTASPVTPITRTNSSITAGQSEQMDAKTRQTNSGTGRITPLSEASQKASSRFGFFARKKPATLPSPDDVARHGRKGPVAGTGYEGLSRYTSRRKSGSSNVSSATHHSMDSTTSLSRTRTSGVRKSDESSLDAFLQERLTPVYLRGDGNASEANTRRSESTADEDPSGIVFTSPRTAFSSQSSMTTPILLPSSATTWSGPGTDSTKSPETKLISRARRDSLDTRSVADIPLAISKGSPRPSTAGPTLTVTNSDLHFSDTLPQPFLMQELHKSTNESIADSANANFVEGKANETPAATSTKTKLGGRWNWFSRSRTSLAESDHDNVARSPKPENISHGNTKPTAHYAIFDSSSAVDFEDLQSIMEEADRVYWESRPSRGKSASNDRCDQSLALGIPDTFRIDGSPRTTPAVPEAYSEHHSPLTVDETPGSTDSGGSSSTDYHIEVARPCRLAQVGRIPRVVSNRDRQRQLPVQSFSRPFIDTNQRPDHSVIQNVAATQEPAKEWPQNVSSDQSGIQYAIDAVAGVDELMPLPQSASGKASPDKAFLEMSPRKDSQASFSSSSRTSIIHTVAATAVLPTPDTPLSPDEIWDEYDDLIADVTAPLSGQPLAPEPGNSLRLMMGKLASDTSKRMADPVVAIGNAPPASTTPDTHKVVSRAPSLAAHQSPQHTRNASQSSSISSRKRQSLLPRGSDLSTVSQRAANGLALLADTGSAQPSSPTSTNRRSSGFADPMSMANLRFGALMVSKWLSFGRVLVSPAHAELENSNTEERMLIYDGLGKDWSYYCALTYSNAQVYSLGPWSAKSANRHSLGGGLDQLPNYRHFSHPDLGANMPFPKAFFSAVVLRFPAVTTEAALRNAISECKRVLRPGGYIEISTLDLDLNNMGNKARRELRELKTKIHAGNPEACLKSASDSLQSLLGRKGFDNLRRCYVGVPVAGVVSGSRDTSRDASVGILELMRDSSEQGDRDITKMVAKVGRWWYSRCYEQGALPDGDLGASMWNDGALLSECEEMGTTFKLLICYAQKPTVAKRRAVSL